MFRGIILVLLAGVAMACCVGGSFADIPDLDNSIFLMPGVGSHSVVLFVLPDGGGSSFEQAQILNDGTEIDARITLQLIDGTWNLIANFPLEDMWLESADYGMIPCMGGTTADVNTNPLGETYWSQPLRASGSSSEDTYIVVNGDPLVGSASLKLRFNSPDINGDGFVNLLDVSLFTTRYFGEYDFTIDFEADGAINLLDLGRMASGMGAQCP